MRTAIILVAAIAAAGFVIYLLTRKRGDTESSNDEMPLDHAHGATDVSVVPMEEPMATGVGTMAPEAITHSVVADDDRVTPVALPAIPRRG